MLYVARCDVDSIHVTSGYGRPDPPQLLTHKKVKPTMTDTQLERPSPAEQSAGTENLCTTPEPASRALEAEGIRLFKSAS